MSYSSGGSLIIPLAWVLTRAHVTVIVSGGFSVIWINTSPSKCVGEYFGLLTFLSDFITLSFLLFKDNSRVELLQECLKRKDDYTRQVEMKNFDLVQELNGCKEQLEKTKESERKADKEIEDIKRMNYGLYVQVTSQVLQLLQYEDEIKDLHAQLEDKGITVHFASSLVSLVTGLFM